MKAHEGKQRCLPHFIRSTTRPREPQCAVSRAVVSTFLLPKLPRRPCSVKKVVTFEGFKLETSINDATLRIACTCLCVITEAFDRCFKRLKVNSKRSTVLTVISVW